MTPTQFVNDIIEVNGRVALDRVFVRGVKEARVLKTRENRSKKCPFPAYFFDDSIGMVNVLDKFGSQRQLTREEFWAAHSK